MSKVGGYWYQMLMKEDKAEQKALAAEFVEKLTKEIEPLLKDVAPFFGGSKKLTLAEVSTASYLSGKIDADMSLGLDRALHSSDLQFFKERISAGVAHNKLG